ncbi:MAG: MATE family efflux transporter [Treponema sp.]|nr:MATE family efflux transporter [Treponema sp.]
MKNDRVDMQNGPLLGKILLFALPIAASSILQQLFNSADVAIVARFAENKTQAVAAIGSNGNVISFIINLFLGISVGANVIIGNLLGQGNKKNLQDAVHTAITVSLISGTALVFIGFFIAKPILILMSTPEDVLDYAVLYLRIYFSGMPFFMLYNFGSAVLRTKGDTKRPLYSLFFSGIINVVLNLLLVILLHMDVAGVAIATVVSQAVSGLLVLSFLINEKTELKVDLRKLHINHEYLTRMIKIGIPAGLQGIVFNISNITIQSAINGFGSSAMAGSAAELNFEYFSFYVVSAFNQTTVTFTSINFGAEKIDRCKKIFRCCMASSVVITGIMVTFFVLFREFFIGLYTIDPVAIKYGVLRMLAVETFDCLINTYEIGASTLRAMGHSLLPTIETIFGVCVFRVMWIFTVFAHFKKTLPPLEAFGTLMLVYPASWILAGSIVLSTYFIIRRKEFTSIQKKHNQ